MTDVRKRIESSWTKRDSKSLTTHMEVRRNVPTISVTMTNPIHSAEVAYVVSANTHSAAIPDLEGDKCVTKVSNEKPRRSQSAANIQMNHITVVKIKSSTTRERRLARGREARLMIQAVSAMETRSGTILKPKELQAIIRSSEKLGLSYQPGANKILDKPSRARNRIEPSRPYSTNIPNFCQPRRCFMPRQIARYAIEHAISEEIEPAITRRHEKNRLP